MPHAPAPAIRVVVPRTDLDASNATELRALLRSHIDESPLCHLELDLSDVEFIDSTGLGVLFGIHCRLRHRGGGLRVVNASPAVERVLLVTGLSEGLMPKQPRRSELAFG